MNSLNDPNEIANTLKKDIARLLHLQATNGFRDKESAMRANSTLDDLQSQLNTLRANFILED